MSLAKFTGTISGTLFLDTNRNGVMDPGEAPVQASVDLLATPAEPIKATKSAKPVKLMGFIAITIFLPANIS